MSNKLKTIQVPLPSTKMARRSFNAPGTSLETTFYKFETCSVRTYFVEVPERGGLSAAITRLKNQFGIDPDTYCKGCQGPLVQSVSVLATELVPTADDILIFVSGESKQLQLGSLYLDHELNK